MADHTISTWADWFYEIRAPFQKNFRSLYPLSANIKRRVDRTVMTGNQGRIPVHLNTLQGGGFITETGTINVPQVVNTTKASFTVHDVVQPVSASPDLLEQSVDNAAASAMTLLINSARDSMAEIENDAQNASGALLGTVASNSTSPSLTVPMVITAGAATNFDRLYPGRVVDILTRSSGADAGNGLRRKIVSYVESTGIVTFSTTQTASDGGSGNITFASTSGVYIAGSYGNATQSIQDLGAVTGTVEGIDKATVAGWQGVDGRGGTTTVVALVDEIMDGAVRRGRRNGAFVWEFGIGDPAVIDLYKQSKYAQVRYDPQTSTIQGGFSGIVYDGADKPIPLIKEDRFENSQIALIPTEDLRYYGLVSGPDWVEDDGAMWRRFSRNLTKEAWLRDKYELVALRCNRIVLMKNLARAA